jgi:hypothetical protein
VPDLTLPAGFSPPRWLPPGDRKHIPQRNWTVEQVIERSKGKDGDAWYHPQIVPDQIRAIEMNTVRDVCEIKGKRKANQRVYWRHVGRVVGLSKGKETEYVYVYYNREGGVHGLPITLQELRNKGVKP